MPPVADAPVHDKTRQKEGAKYGCYNRPRKAIGDAVTGSPAYGSQSWPVVNTTACRSFHLWAFDPMCQGCTVEKDREYEARCKIIWKVA